jgi:ribosomal protein S18 acetylase RimI-like enzyme
LFLNKIAKAAPLGVVFAILHIVMNISIRKAKPEDAEGNQRVFYETWLATYPNGEVGITKEDIEKHFENAFTEKSISDMAERLRTSPKNKLNFVAIDEDTETIVGLCGITLHETYNQLQKIYVLPSYQGKGIGTLLWNAVQEFFDPKKDVIVQVAIYNAQAIAFYANLGFVDTGKRFEEERHRMPISGVMIPEMEMIIKKQLN